jgi:hypothetical protein
LKHLSWIARQNNDNLMKSLYAGLVIKTYTKHNLESH